MIFRVKISYKYYDFKNQRDAMTFAITAKMRQFEDDDVTIQLIKEEEDND